MKLNKQGKLTVIGISCVFAIVCIWLFCTSIGTKDNPAPETDNAATTQQAPQEKKPVKWFENELKDRGKKKLSPEEVDKLTDFSKINTKPVEDPGY